MQDTLILFGGKELHRRYKDIDLKKKDFYLEFFHSIRICSSFAFFSYVDGYDDDTVQVECIRDDLQILRLLLKECNVSIYRWELYDKSLSNSEPMMAGVDFQSFLKMLSIDNIDWW